MPRLKKHRRGKKKKKKTVLLPPLSPPLEISLLLPSLISTTSSLLSFLRSHDLLLSPSQTLSLESLLHSSSLSLKTLTTLFPSPTPSPPLNLPIIPKPPLSWFHRFLTSQHSTFPSIITPQDSIKTHQDNIKNHQDSSKKHQDSSKIHQDNIKTHQDSTFSTKNHQDSSKKHQDSSKNHQDFIRTNQDSTKNHQDLSFPTKIHQESSKTHQDSSFPTKIHQESSKIHQDFIKIHQESSKIHQDSTFTIKNHQDSIKTHQDFDFPIKSHQDFSFSIKTHQDSSFPPQRNQDLDFPLWVHFFNVSQPSFTLLLELLAPQLASLAPVQPHYALAATLYRLAHGVSFSVIGRRFEMEVETACRAFYTVVKVMNENLGHLFEFQEDISRVIVGFGWISLPNCCGVLGFERFGVDGEVLGENGSLIVQGLVDSEGRFLDVSAGWPSTLTADSILRKSMLFSGVEESKDYLNGSSYKLSDGNSIPQYILGESSFPLLPWLLTPYKKPSEDVELSETEMVFNSVHSKGIELVRKAFGKVKSRWKLVAKNAKGQSMEAFPAVIVACCLLHNFLIKSGDEGKLMEENVEFSGEQFFPAFEGDGEADGRKIRDLLALHLCRVSQRR